MRGPFRTCVGCGQRDHQHGLLRFRLSEGGVLELTVGAASRGRTAYVHAREDCVVSLARSKRIDRSLRTRVPADARQLFAQELAVANDGGAVRRRLR